MAKKTYIHPEMEIELLENVDVIITSGGPPTGRSTDGVPNRGTKIQAPIDAPTEAAPSTEEVTISAASDISETPTSEPESVVESAPVEGAGSGEMAP